MTLTVSDFLGAGTTESLAITAAPVSAADIPVTSKEGALLFATLLMISALAVLRRGA